MKATSAATLEYESLRALLGRYVSSPPGKAELARIAPHTDAARLAADLADAGEAIEYLRSASRPQTAARGAAIRIEFGGFPDLTEAVHKLRIEGASLEGKEIFDLFGVLDRAADAKSLLNAVAERFPRLGARAQSIGDFRALLKDLEGKILPDGSVADHASVALARLRRDIERQRKSIQGSLERFLKSHQEEGVLQEEFVTIRNERFVVPIVAGQRRRIDGVIHAASASGHTLFVEPLETIDLNNELVRLTEEESQEVHRILRELTARLRGYAESIRQTMATLGELEMLFAKARFAVDFDCAIPRFGARLLLRDARHPLLQDVLRRQRKPVVPISLELDERSKTLLISGPNTGGKTVTLKTVGLLTLMAQSGLPVPAAKAEFPIFGQVLADIGDNQSIQESLSTFSAHISHIREMALDVTPDSLVLLDELGAATDPEEGGALGVAIVEHFRAAGAYTLASTHLLALKIYGANTQGVLNASMGFDEQTLEPTYVLHTGMPGKSAGLEIATRLGMPEDIMNRARAALSDRERDLGRFISELHQRLKDVQTLEADLRQKQADLVAREKEVAREWEKRESSKLKELERRTEQMLAKFEEQAQQTIGQIVQGAEQRKLAEQAQRRVAKTKRELREEFQTTVLSTQDESRHGDLSRPKIEEGARVRLQGIREPARVRRILAGDRLEVEAGFMKMQVSVDDVLEVLPDLGGAGGAARLPQNVTFKRAPELAPVHQEINVIGQRAEEARDNVDQFLDRAVMATASRVRIVHGHGMGILRKVLWELLERHPHVEKHYQAPPQEGGTGATIVELKE
ncbi:MAG TPA: endonuclease MutS2 [Bryobacteraceae bacterium]|jgi:DNA mismatch repair protein MutS2|nr:endonuclease MutS2 [Bryobacteraceae bacterium]